MHPRLASAKFMSVLAASSIALLLAGCSGSHDAANAATSDVGNSAEPAAPSADTAAPENAAAPPAANEAGAPTPAPTAAAAPSPAPVPLADAAPAGNAANGQKLFVQCQICHSTEPDRNGLGPSLHGVIGRHAGTLAGFSYSPAMKNSGITWDPATLSDFLRAPMRDVPGTKMAFAGIADDQKRADVIAYLATVK